ncbi:MAG: VOC family protein, partial [Proteobacteria bacterium]|nr:VOC family protein [Pseudomonadota bacterium]
GFVKIHLSDHHGDASPGVTIGVQLSGVRAVHADLIGKNYKYNRPSLEEMPYGATVMNAVDPFGNRLRFTETAAASSELEKTPRHG